MSHVNPSDETLTKILVEARTIAMVGASSDPERPSHRIMRRMLDAGYRVIPVNPKETEVHGQRAYGSLGEIPDPIDIVDVFRRSEDAPAIADEAIAVHAKVLWLQLGVSSEEAARRAEAAGLTVVMDRCIGATHIELQIPRKH
jgi:predicted CoA-binding protein